MFEDHYVVCKLRDKVKVALNLTGMICGWPKVEIQVDHAQALLKIIEVQAAEIKKIKNSTRCIIS